MGTKIIHKGLKYISQIFVVKDPELEIGCPTDVKHVAHIGWDGPSGSAPSWMSEFKTAPDYAATSIGNINESTRGSSAAISPWSSVSNSESMDRQQASELLKEVAPSTDPTKIPKKPKRKKVRPTTASSAKSVRSNTCSSPKSVRSNTSFSPKSVRPSASSPKSSPSTRSSPRPAKSKAKFVEDHAKPSDLEVM